MTEDCRKTGPLTGPIGPRLRSFPVLSFGLDRSIALQSVYNSEVDNLNLSLFCLDFETSLAGESYYIMAN